MANLKKVFRIGNLTRDPELRDTTGGTSVCTLGLAVNDRYKQGDEWVERVNFFDVVVWGAQAENCKRYLSKGRPVAIDGRLSYRTWEAQDGGRRSKVEVVAQSVQFLNAASGKATSSKEEAVVPADDDVPF